VLRVVLALLAAREQLELLVALVGQVSLVLPVHLVRQVQMVTLRVLVTQGVQGHLV